MKLSVHLNGEILAIPCGKGAGTVRTIGETAIQRYVKLKSGTQLGVERVAEIRKSKGGAILDPDDIIKDILDDNDFVTIGMFLEFIQSTI